MRTDVDAASDVDAVTVGTHGREYERDTPGGVSRRVVSARGAPVLTVTVGDGGERVARTLASQIRSNG